MLFTLVHSALDLANSHHPTWPRIDPVNLTRDCSQPTSSAGCSMAN